MRCAVFDFARCIVRDRVLAEDVVQDVFLRLWNRPGSYDPARGSLRSYLLTMTYGRSVDIVRSESSRHTSSRRMTSPTWVWLSQHLIPKNLSSAIVYRATRSRRPWLKRPLTSWFARAYGVDMS